MVKLKPPETKSKPKKKATIKDLEEIKNEIEEAFETFDTKEKWRSEFFRGWRKDVKASRATKNDRFSWKKMQQVAVIYIHTDFAMKIVEKTTASFSGGQRKYLIEGLEKTIKFLNDGKPHTVMEVNIPKETFKTWKKKFTDILKSSQSEYRKRSR